MQVSLLEIFLTFLKVGGMIFGGGLVIIPLLEKDVVQKKGWITSEELIEYYAISQVIPGINIPDVCMFIGYKLRGKSGATVAGLGIVFIPFMLMVLVSYFLSTVAHLGIIKSILWGISVGTIVVIYTVIQSILKRSIVDKFTFWFFMLILSLSFINLSPVWIVIIALSLGVIKGLLVKPEEENN